MNISNSSSVEKIVQKILIEEKPKTVRKLIERTLKLTQADKNQIYQIIKDLEKRKEIHLGSSKITRKLPNTFSDFLFKPHYFSIEFWLILGLTLLFFISVILIPETSPLLFLRVIIGGLFGFLIPGWTIVNLVFPRLYEAIDQFERILIAFGINIGVLIFSGLILNQIWVMNTLAFVIIIGTLTVLVLFLSSLLRILIGTEKLVFNVSISRFNIFKKRDSK